MHVDAELLQHALVGYEAQLAQVNKKITEIRQSLAAEHRDPAWLAAPKKRRRLSAATRAKMRAAQQNRWAKIHARPAKSHNLTHVVLHPKKRHMSAAARKAISRAAKARWAAYRAKAAKKAKKAA